jgi:hypothetical protein
MRSYLDPESLIALTAGRVTGAYEPADTWRDWSISSSEPTITREFTGMTLAARGSWEQLDHGLTITRSANVSTLIGSQADMTDTYPILVKVGVGDGLVFVSSNESAPPLGEHRLAPLYYDYDFFSFSQIVPLMMVIRYSAGDEAWHNDHDYANFTIDDPALTEPWGKLSYKQLLEEMEAHNFHTTIAMHPIDWQQSEPTVVSLFLTRRDRFSLAQHGNNGDGYEFYRYHVTDQTRYQGRSLRARPLAEQRADIAQGLFRLAKHRASTQIEHDRVMVFPFGISPEPTLVILKGYNYLGTVNAVEIPLGASMPDDWLYGMYPATLAFGNFPSLSRWCYRRLEDFEPLLPFSRFDLFIDKPLIFCSHTYEGNDLAQGRMDAFNPIADFVNGLAGEVEWRSLGSILRHLYLKKHNDDGSVDVQIYTAHVFIENTSATAKDYHIHKLETLNVPIKRLEVNGQEFPYTVERDVLTLDVQIPPLSSIEVEIVYGRAAE